MLGIWDKIQRLKHNRGFGVQSPAAFHFVTQVLRNKGDYYIYPELDNVAIATGEYSPVHCRRLFRIANYIQPKNIILYKAGTGSAACALSAGKKRVPCYIIAPENSMHSTAKRFLRDRECKYTTANPLEELKHILEKEGRLGLLHITADEHLPKAIEIATKYINKQSVIIVEGIHRSKVQSQLWEQAKEHCGSIVTFDLYSMGIMFFDSGYQKQLYTLLLQ